MAIQQSIFINKFASGAQENANIGFGTFLGVETYNKKGVAQLTKDTTKVSGSVVTDLVVYWASATADIIFGQGDSGKTYRSTDGGTTWTDITNANGYSSGAGKGLVFFDGFLYAFRGTQIEYCASPFGAANWGVAAFQTGLSGASSYTPFIYPNARGFYFGNGFKLGILRQAVTGTAINPTSASTYFYSNSIFQLPSIYEIKCLSFLPPNLLMMGTGSSGIGNDTQIADIISWDTISLNLFGAPLRLFSQGGAGTAGVNQLINRNNILYAVTSGNAAIFSTNGSTFNLVADLSLRTTVRLIPGGLTGIGNGQQATAPIFLNPRVSAIAVQGNKLYTAPSAQITSAPTGYGNFPFGVWSVAFTDEQEAIQCEFPLSNGLVISNSVQIGGVYPLFQSQMLVSWFDGNATYGIDKTDFTTFQSDSDVVVIESEMMEIGTPLEPSTVPVVQVNLVRPLISGQTIILEGRSGFDQAYTSLQTFTSTDGNSIHVDKNSLGSMKFLQLRLKMATSNPNQAWTPEIRSVIVSP